ncbi:MAG: FAD:protein FMN transferase [Candidatus Dormibacteria bacterium]
MDGGWTRLPPVPGLSGAWRPALGTTARVLIADGPQLAPALREADQVITRVDDLASRFRPDSELSRVNADPRPEISVSDGLAALLADALLWSRATDGLLDPTIGAALLAAGYDRDFSQLDEHASAPGAPSAPAPGWHQVRLEGKVLTRPRGVLLDLGATAKASAADDAASRVLMASGVACLVSLGGDIATAGPVPAGGWTVRIGDDHRGGGEQPGQTVCLLARGMATSSTAVRRWIRQGASMHHLIDPRTGRPAQGRWRTATVVADTCLRANALSTAALVAGDLAEGLLSQFSAAARLVAVDGRVVHIGGWPSRGEELSALPRRSGG